MLDKLQRIAQAIQFFRLPSLGIGFICLGSLVAIIFTSTSQEGDRFLLPSFVGLIWGMSTHSFIVTFRSVPEKASSTLGSFGKLRRNIVRGWYWCISVVFLGATAGAIFVTYRMVSFWVRDYSG